MIIFLGFIICMTQVIVKNKAGLIKNHSQLLKNNYEHSFYEAVNYMNDVDNLLTKVQLTKLPKQNINMFAQIWRSSSAAHDNLSNLPYNHNSIMKALKYLSQTSDFSYAMMNKSIDDEDLSAEEWETLNNLKTYAQNLSKEMDTILTDANVSEKINWDALAQENFDKSNLVGSMQNVNKQFQDYGELIYDGPFSDHIQNLNPKMLVGKTEVSKLDALEKAKKILLRTQNEIKNIEYSGQVTSRKNLPAYSFTAKNNDDEEIYLEITKNGAYPLLMITAPTEKISENKINSQEAITTAKKFLADNDFINMKESYYERFENYLTINFAPFENNLIMYPDLMKVKVNLANGKISGFESLGYIMMHCERQPNEPTLPYQLLDELLPIGFEKLSTKRCVIPLDSKKETFCYEVIGKFNENKFIIYINNDSGKFEKIYKLIENERGTQIGRAHV